MQPEPITLVFPSSNALWGFVRDFRINYLELDDTTFTLVCIGEGLDKEAIKEKYGAKLVKP